MSDDERKRVSSGQVRALPLPTDAIIAEHKAVFEWAVSLLISSGKSEDEARALVQAASGKMRLIVGNAVIAHHERIKEQLGLQRMT